jgi:glycosyltransferase involved in cell wall biosynthesis
VRRADTVARTASSLKHLGLNADIIIGHHGWGEMLNLRDVWPDAAMLGYLEFYYHPDKVDVGFDPEFPIDRADFPRIRAKNAINHIALDLGGEGQTPTQWQLSTYPEWSHPGINLVWEGVNLNRCKPDAKARHASLKIGDMTIRPTDKLVTYVARDLEPYRGFHLMMRTLPHLLRSRKDIKVVMVGGDGISYGMGPSQGGTWRERMMQEVGEGIDLKRVVFPGRIDYATYVSMMQRSDAHVYLTYPFVASWSLREALAIGCAVIGSDTPTVREFVADRDNGLLASFFDPPGLARTVLEVLEDKELDRRLRTNARQYAEKCLSMDDYLASYVALIERMTGTTLPKIEPEVAAASSRGKRAEPAEAVLEPMPASAPPVGVAEPAEDAPLAATTPLRKSTGHLASGPEPKPAAHRSKGARALTEPEPMASPAPRRKSGARAQAEQVLASAPASRGKNSARAAAKSRS